MRSIECAMQNQGMTLFISADWLKYHAYQSVDSPPRMRMISRFDDKSKMPTIFGTSLEELVSTYPNVSYS